MIIDRHNCEAFFLDYHEGNLSPVQAGEVLLFLEENPDLKNLFEEYENISLEQEKIFFPGKDMMKKKYSAEGIESLLSSEINSDNCEQFFIAYVEGQLSSERISKLNSFLANNPGQKKEFELFKLSKLSGDKVSFEGKESLKKSLITKENCEEYFIRSAEKDLNRVEEEQLKSFLQKNPEYKKEFELFSKTILPAEIISFENKFSLKKKERKPVFVSIFSQRQTYYAAAAAILLLIGLFFILKNNGTEKQLFADKNKPVKKTENVMLPEKESNTNKENSVQKNKIRNDKQPNIQTTEHSNVKSPKPAIIEEKKQLQPIIFEDEEKLIAEKENEKPKMMEQELIVEKKQEEKKEDAINPTQETASANTGKTNEDYQTVGSFTRKKVRQVLGIKKSVECADDKITVWDVAMAAKAKVQDIIGTKAVDVEKVCDGKGDSEYVFTAGSFSLSRNSGK
ncbi:MAG: hypothetical protein HY063_04770 [Bacteroidetes bacterium]|nr:hypothetical protein [Bacteroidota bacterium]